MLMPRYSDQDSHNDNSFIGKHSHASSTVAAHTKMRLLSKVEQNMRQQSQQQNQTSNHNKNINKLINTAATANGLVGDVDELLMPMRIKTQVPPAMPGGYKIENGFEGGSGSGSGSGSGGGGGSVNGNASFNGSANGKDHSNSRPERNLWSRAEMLEMLSIMQHTNALEQLNDRNVRSEHVFRQIEEMMRSKGYVKKSSIQIWTKWKFLKSTYNTTTRHGTGIPKVVPEEVYRVLCRLLRDNASANGSGSGNGSDCGNSMDSSNMELGKTFHDNEESKDELGVEHPIFGFRLGLIKPEPLDTGYETALNEGKSSDPEIETVESVESDAQLGEQTHSALEHIPFMVTVKNEPEMDLGMDGTNTPPPTAPTSPSPPPTMMEQRDNERSDRNDRSHINTSTPQSISLPPLRVAAFASDAQQRATTSTPTHGVLQIERPAVSFNKMGLSAGPSKGNRTMPLHSTSSINFVHPTSKLMLPRKKLPLLLPREISLQPASVRAMKSVPLRETGYSLRPDRMIPDLEQSISPPQSPSPPMPKYTNPYASTSRQAQMLSEQQQRQQQLMRKRRMQYPQPSPVPVKLQRSSNLYDQHSSHSTYRNEDASGTFEHRSKRMDIAVEAQRRKKQQDEFFKTELTQLATAMRVAQKEMLQNFFQQQKQFARREHEFQLKQDHLVMSALRKQSDALIRSAKDLLQSEEKKTESQTLAESQDEDEEEEKEDSSLLIVEPEIELREALEQSDEEEYDEHVLEEDDDELEEEEGEEPDQELEQYEEDTQYSDDGDQSEAAMDEFTSAVSEEGDSSLFI